jgi:hypothetical protein
MADYVTLPLADDPDALLEVGVDYMEGAISGFVARPGNVETVLLEANSQIAAEVIQQAEIVPPLVFAYAGESLFGLPPYAAVPATATATIMVGVTALESGANGNGAFGTSELIDVVVGVETIYVNTATGGVDAESDTDYLDRLADALTLLAPRPILPNDFAVMARQEPGVERAVALDLYQPGTDDNITAAQPGGPLAVEGTPVNAGAGVANVPRCVTTIITAEGGAAPSQALMHAVWLRLDGAREVNFLAYVMAPRYTGVDVQATVHPFPGYTPVDVQAAAVAMLGQWLDPSSWGGQPTVTTDAVQQWATDNKVRIYEAVDWLNRAEGVYYVKSVQVRKVGDAAWSDVDITLPGTVALPVSGTFTITVDPAP